MAKALIQMFSIRINSIVPCTKICEQCSVDRKKKYLSQAFIDNQTLVGMKVMSKDPGKVWCIWRVYLGVINAENISGLYQFVTELRLKKWKNSNLKWWNFENLKFWFFSPHFLCVWAGPKLLTHNIGPYVGSLSSKKNFFFFGYFSRKLKISTISRFYKIANMRTFLCPRIKTEQCFGKLTKFAFQQGMG